MHSRQLDNGGSTISALGIRETVRGIVARRPALSRIFENRGIDYCCGGKKSLEDATKERQLDPNEVLQQLTQAMVGKADPRDVTYRAILDALARLERDLHQHIHKENNVLFPRARELEAHKSRAHYGR